MIVCEICTGRHLTSACVIGDFHVRQCFSTEPTRRPDQRVVADNGLDELFEYRRLRVAAERAAWEDERRRRNRANANANTAKYRARLRLVS